MEDQEIASKISLFVALGPVTKLTNSKIMNFTVENDKYKSIAEASEKYNIYALGTNKETPLESELFFKFCEATGPLCKWLTEFPLTSKTKYDDNEALNLSMAKQGGRVPTKGLLHFGQCIREDRF